MFSLLTLFTITGNLDYMIYLSWQDTTAHRCIKLHEYDVILWTLLVTMIAKTEHIPWMVGYCALWKPLISRNLVICWSSTWISEHTLLPQELYIKFVLMVIHVFKFNTWIHDSNLVKYVTLECSAQDSCNSPNYLNGKKKSFYLIPFTLQKTSKDWNNMCKIWCLAKAHHHSRGDIYQYIWA